jgi:hypothetical protein
MKPIVDGSYKPTIGQYSNYEAITESDCYKQKHDDRDLDPVREWIDSHFFLVSLRGRPPAKLFRRFEIREKNLLPLFFKVASPPARPIFAITSGASFLRMG